jgi:hypothetical protein
MSLAVRRALYVRHAVTKRHVEELTVKPSKRQLLDDKDVLALLKAEIAKAGSQSTWARQHRVDRPSVCATLNGNKKTSPQLIKALGLKKIVVYTRL